MHNETLIRTTLIYMLVLTGFCVVPLTFSAYVLGGRAIFLPNKHDENRSRAVWLGHAYCIRDIGDVSIKGWCSSVYIPHVQKFEKAFYSVCETFQHSMKNVAIKSLSEHLEGLGL
jgi:hypothetical protein